MPQPVMLKKLKLNSSMITYNPSRTNTHKRCPFYYRGLECKRSKIHFHHIIPGNTHSQQDIVGAVNHGQEVEPVFSAGRLLFLPSFTLHQQGVTESNLHSNGGESASPPGGENVRVYYLEFSFKQVFSLQAIPNTQFYKL